MNGSPLDPRKRRPKPVSGSPLPGVTRVDSKAGRLRIGRSEILETRSWLTQRDREICNDVFEHKVLTAVQIQHLHFTHPRVASRRLLKLFEHQVVDRFRPREGLGSAPNHYILGELGAHIIAGERGLDLKKLRDRRRTDLKLAYSPRLSHLVEVNEFFTWLTVACRDSDGGYRLVRWWSERRCAMECRDVVRPDALGELTGERGSCTFLFELDRGTERGDRLSEKLRSYEWFARIKKDTADAVLFLFPGHQREARARQKLDPFPGLVVATTHEEAFYGDPLGAVWLPLESDQRVQLLDVPRRRGDWFQ